MANGRRGGSDPPRNGPRLRERATRGGRPGDLSLLDGPARLGGCGGALFALQMTSAIPVNSHDPSYKAASLPSHRFPDAGAGDRVWKLRVP